MEENKEKIAQLIVEDTIAKMKKGEITSENAFCAVYFAAASENPVAQFFLACFYLEGIGCEINGEKGIELLQKAAAGSWAAAQGELGRRYLKGEGVEQNYKEAVKWLRLAAEQGDSNAANYLVDCYVHGWGVEPDQSEVLKWLEVVSSSKDVMEDADSTEEDFVFSENDLDEALEINEKIEEILVENEISVNDGRYVGYNPLNKGCNINAPIIIK